MLHEQRPTRTQEEVEDEIEIREIHALTPAQQPPQVSNAGRRRESWETSSHRSSTLSVGSEAALSEQFSSMSREFTAMVVAGSNLQNNENNDPAATAGGGGAANSLARIGEEELEETNPLAIVPDNNPLPSPSRIAMPLALVSADAGGGVEDVSLPMVKKEEVESKISAWQTAEIAKVNNRFKRQEAIINGWEGEQVEKATAWLKKIERKLEEQRARALEKTQNEIAKARMKAAEKRASAEGKRGTKVAKILELSNVLKAVGRAPSKRSFF